MKRLRRAASAGFTLVEMMTVVVIIGILAAIAIAFLSNPTDVETATRNIASAIGEGARLAVTRGPLPADVVANTGEPDRLRVDIETSPPEVTIWLQIETGGVNAQFYEVQKIVLPAQMVIAGASDEADLTGGAIQTAGDASFGCSSNGQCDPKTIYVSLNTGTDKYRIVILPLSSAPQVFPGW